MELINQLAAPLAQSAQVARQQSSEKTQQIRRAQTARKNVAAGQESDTFEHTVESAEAITPIHDEQPHEQQQPQSRRSKSKRGSRPATDGGDPPPTIDVTA
jgi:hypothetical protein